MPGMDEASPRARPLPFVLICALLAGQVVLRYEFDFLYGKEWQALHLTLGLAMGVGVIALFHGAETIRRVRGRTWATVVGACVLLILFWYLGRMDSWRRWWEPMVEPGGRYSRVYGFMYFSSCAVLFRTLLPFGLAWLLWRTRPGELGLFAPGNPHDPAVRRIWPVYLILFLGILPFVFGVAETEAFQNKYPMSRPMIVGGVIAFEDFLVYQAFYLFIFVSGEGFWRGIYTFGMERDFGLYALPLMAVPYVTAHFGKPLPETLGAIAAGVTLGWLALKHRSVWLGVALHYGVALSMDLLAIRANGFVIE
ncbi:MAG: CPBP family glutamic-type intramembrane protease [Myxococcota bacterium]